LNLLYVLVVTIGIPHAIDLHVTIPVTIGNVPFRGGEPAGAGINSYPPSQNPPSVPTAPYPPPTANPYPPVSPLSESFDYLAAYPPVNIELDYTMGETQYAPVYGFVTDYQFAPPPSYAEATVKVKGEEN